MVSDYPRARPGREPLRCPFRRGASYSCPSTRQFSWLPDNRHIVVSVAEIDRPWRLYLADTVSGRFRPLTDGTGTAHRFGPVVSPDGRRFVFSEIATNLDIVTVNMHTAQVSTPLATTRNEWAPAWAADGTSLVYVTDRNGQEEIWLREPNGRERPLVTPGQLSAGNDRFLHRSSDFSGRHPHDVHAGGKK